VSSPPDILLGDWQLVHGRGPKGEVLVPDGHQVTLTVGEQGWAGTATCNRCHGNVVVEGDALAVGPVAVTRMACADPAVTVAEAAYLAAFTEVERWSIEAGRLQLAGPGVQLVFVPAAAP